MAEAVIKDLDHVQALSLEHSVLAERGVVNIKIKASL